MTSGLEQWGSAEGTHDAVQAVAVRVQQLADLTRSTVAVVQEHDDQPMTDSDQELILAALSSIALDLSSIVGWLGDIASGIPCPDD